MSSALSEIDQRIDSRCLVRSMNKGGCTLDTTDAPAPFRIIDLDHAAAPVRSTARKCDYLFLAETDDGGGLRHVVPFRKSPSSRLMIARWRSLTGCRSIRRHRRAL